jgi:hypothetical protein
MLVGPYLLSWPVHPDAAPVRSAETHAMSQALSRRSFPPPEASRPRVSTDFADALLAALTEMAALSPRRQADVAVAMRRAGLSADAEAVEAGLAALLRDGCIEPPLALSDGGILAAVTVRGVEYLATTSHRHAAAGMIAGRLG